MKIIALLSVLLLAPVSSDQEPSQAPETEISQAPETEISQAPETEISQAPETEVSQAPETETSPIPETDMQEIAFESQSSDPNPNLRSSNEATSQSSGPEAEGGTPVPETIEVVGKPTRRAQLEESAEQVDIIDFSTARIQTADISEVLARQAGVSMQRGGGLGSRTRICLNGLCDKQITFFIDGIPTEAAGYPSSGAFGLQFIPVNFVDRVEIHRGVVPIRLGADSLGGAVNFVTTNNLWSGASASYQAGSYGTHSVTAAGRYVDEDSGFMLSASGLYSTAVNDYEVDVPIDSLSGATYQDTVRRFHDGLTSYGGFVEVGVIDQSWAERLTLKGFVSTYDKDLQHNVVMTVPYGEATYGETTGGGLLRYEGRLSDSLELSMYATYSHRIIDFVDKADSVYSWYGDVINSRGSPGEINVNPTDQTHRQHTAAGRMSITWSPSTAHKLTLISSPYYVTRVGEERLLNDGITRDPLDADREMFRLVTGMEYNLELFQTVDVDGNDDYIIKGTTFVKSYFYTAFTEEYLASDVFNPLRLETHDVGIGSGLRLRVTPWLSFKLAYEFAARLPNVDEVFGNGVLIDANLNLKPERSHNSNLTGKMQTGDTAWGRTSLELNAFWRESENLIFLMGQETSFLYLNAASARVLGVEATMAWTSPRKWVHLDGTLTYSDARNSSREGPLSAYEGDRIPSRPYLMASWGARGRIAGLPGADDVLEPYYVGRFVNEFFRGWESLGNLAYKDIVDEQLTHNVGVSYTFSGSFGRATGTFEISNITDATVFDFFGVQKPGRVLSLKLVITI